MTNKTYIPRNTIVSTLKNNKVKRVQSFNLLKLTPAFNKHFTEMYIFSIFSEFWNV